MARVMADADRKPTSAEIKAGQRELTATLKTKPETHLKCRTMRHAWTQKNVVRLIKPQTRRDLPILVIDFVCDRGCDVVRHDTLVVRQLRNGDGYEVIERLHPSYTYPESYPIPGIPRGVRSSTIYWQEFVRRQAETIAHVEPGEHGTAEP